MSFQNLSTRLSTTKDSQSSVLQYIKCHRHIAHETPPPPLLTSKPLNKLRLTAFVIKPLKPNYRRIGERQLSSANNSCKNEKL